MEESVRKMIEKRAYELFLKRNGEHGYHIQDWNQAEKEVMAELEKKSASEAKMEKKAAEKPETKAASAAPAKTAAKKRAPAKKTSAPAKKKVAKKKSSK
ncbi:MAG: DUF2934 domain-containing protein [Chitinispirillaceae bacterium]